MKNKRPDIASRYPAYASQPLNAGKPPWMPQFLLSYFYVTMSNLVLPFFWPLGAVKEPAPRHDSFLKPEGKIEGALAFLKYIRLAGWGAFCTKTEKRAKTCHKITKPAKIRQRSLTLTPVHQCHRFAPCVMVTA
jgi:hypothetical protein